jgi:hypothetical protein
MVMREAVFKEKRSRHVQRRVHPDECQAVPGSYCSTTRKKREIELSVVKAQNNGDTLYSSKYRRSPENRI